MKKRFYLFVFAPALLCAAFLFAVPALAADSYVYDTAGVLTYEQWKPLEEYAARISQNYDCGVYIAAVESFADYGVSVEDASENIYRDNGFGLHDDASGILLLLSMADRTFDIYANGYGTYALGDSGRDAVTGAMLDSLRVDDWYGAFESYLRVCESLLDMAGEAYEPDGAYEPGGPYAVYDAYDAYGTRAAAGRSLGTCIAIGLAVGVAVALIVCLILRAKMKSVKKATAALAYAVPGSFEIYESTDRFSHVTETRVKVESDNPNRSGGGGGGGGGSRPSGGGSHGGGSF